MNSIRIACIKHIRRCGQNYINTLDRQTSEKSSLYFNFRKLSDLSSKAGKHVSVESQNWSTNNEVKKNGFVVPSFDNHKEAFRSKSFLELLQAFVIFKLCSVELIVNNQLQIFKWARQLMGKRLFRALMKRTIYDQFLAGETNTEVFGRVKKNAKYGIIPMIAYTAAEVHGHTNKLEYSSKEIDNFFKANANAIMTSIDMAEDMKGLGDHQPMVSSKMTFIKPAQLMEDASALIMFNRNTIRRYEREQHHSSEAQDFMDMINKWVQSNSIVNSLDAALMNLQFHLDVRKIASHNFKSYNQEQGRINLDEKELVHMANIVTDIGKKAEERGVITIWDTEQTYINPVIDVLALDAMRMCNTRKGFVHNTYQCYLKNTYNDVLCDTSIAKSEGFCWGGKIVRGGYIEEERSLAEKLGYEDPVNPTYDATTGEYYKVINYLLNEIQNRPRGQLQMTVATHNSDTIKYVLQRLNEDRISPGNDIRFAQLLGMRDHISFTLGQSNIPVAKLVHYGPIEDCIAYISRRVKENRGAIITANVERFMLGKEIRRRLLRK